MNYPKALDENKRFRLEVILKAKNNPKLQALLLQKCLNDILFFVNVFGWTYDPRVEPSILPFITFEYQDDTILKLVYAIENREDVFIEKSRDMGMSWMLVVLQVWGWLKGWSSLYGSYKEDYVDSKGDMDSHFERIRFTIERLPKWLVPQDTTPTYMNISSKELNCNIAGDAGVNFGTGGRRKFVVMDEFPLWQDDKKAFRKTKDITNCRIIGGTPEGKYNVYGQVMTNAPDYQHLNIVRIRLHWSLHPNKDQAWYEEQKSKRTKLDVAKELDISYEDSVTGKVYPEFTERATFQKLEYNPALPLYCGWDFGKDMNAIIWTQKDFATNKVYLLDAYQVPNKPIEFMASFVLGIPINDPVTKTPFVYDDEELKIIERHAIWKAVYAGHWGDPFNGNATQTNARSSIKQSLAQFDIHVSCRTTGTSLEERIRKAHLIFPRLIVNTDCYDFMQSIVHSKYPDDTKQMTTEKTKPVHDRSSHFRTAFEYFVDNEPMLPTQTSPLTYSQRSPTIQPKSLSDFEREFGGPSPTRYRTAL